MSGTPPIPGCSVLPEFFLNVHEFHVVLNSSTCGINLKRITQQLHDVNVCSLKSSILCWKSSISVATNSEYLCCTVSVGLVGFVGWMETPGRPDSGLRVVCWTPLSWSDHHRHGNTSGGTCVTLYCILLAVWNSELLTIYQLLKSAPN